MIDGEGRVNPNTERTRRFRQRQKEREAEQEQEQTPTPPAVITVTPENVEAAAVLGGVVWDIVAPFTRLRPLSDEQRQRLGVALAPLVVKYLPILGNWQYEVAALLCVMSLARENHIPKGETVEPLGNGEVPPETETEESADGGTGVPVTSGHRATARRAR